MFGLYVCDNKSWECSSLVEAISSNWANYQTLIAALVTLGVGVSAIIYARKNYRTLEAQNDHLKEEKYGERIRRRDEARAMLPVYASELIFYTRSVLIFYNQLYMSSTKEGSFGVPVPLCPMDTVKELSKTVSVYDEDDGAGLAILEIIKTIQIVNSRCGSEHQQICKSPKHLKYDSDYSELILASKLFAWVNRLFDYGRYDVEEDKWESENVDLGQFSDLELRAIWVGPRKQTLHLERAFNEIYDPVNGKFRINKSRSLARSLYSKFIEAFGEQYVGDDKRIYPNNFVVEGGSVRVNFRSGADWVHGTFTAAVIENSKIIIIDKIEVPGEGSRPQFVAQFFKSLCAICDNSRWHLQRMPTSIFAGYDFSEEYLGQYGLNDNGSLFGVMRAPKVEVTDDA